MRLQEAQAKSDEEIKELLPGELVDKHFLPGSASAGQAHFKQKVMCAHHAKPFQFKQALQYRALKSQFWTHCVVQMGLLHASVQLRHPGEAGHCAKAG